MVGLLVLSFGWVLCAELGFKYRDKISFEKFGLSFSGGWELGEAIVGIEQDLVIITLGVWYVMA